MHDHIQSANPNSKISICYITGNTNNCYISVRHIQRHKNEKDMDRLYSPYALATKGSYPVFLPMHLG